MIRVVCVRALLVASSPVPPSFSLMCDNFSVCNIEKLTWEDYVTGVIVKFSCSIVASYSIAKTCNLSKMYVPIENISD